CSSGSPGRNENAEYVASAVRGVRLQPDRGVRRLCCPASAGPFRLGGSMATFERHVEVDWRGSVMEGKGEAKAGSGAFTLPVTFPSRIGDANGKTSPEELMAAAHAACYAMALNGTLGRKSASPDRSIVRATVTAD